MASLRKFSIVLIALALFAGLAASPAAAQQLALNCNTGNFPTAMTSGTYYNMSCSATGGSGSYSWSLLGGSSYPAGMAFVPSGGTVTLSGTPYGANTYTFTIILSDGTSSLNFSDSVTVGGGTSTGGGSVILSQLSPATIPAGSGTFPLTIYGTGFTSSSYVLFDNIQLFQTSYSSTSLVVSVPASLVATVNSFQVYVITSTTQSNGLPFTVTASTGPTLQSIYPTTIAAGSIAGTFQMTLTGSNFAQGVLVTFGNYTLNSTYASSNTLYVTIPGSYITTPGIIYVSVGGSTATQQQFTITSSGTGALTVSCSPAAGPTVLNSPYGPQVCTVSGGVSPYSWTVSGLPTGLYQSAASGTNQLQINGTPTVAGSYTYVVSVHDSTSPTNLMGSQTITGAITSSGTGSLSVTSLQPASSSLNPSQPLSFAVYGTGFTTASTIYFASQPLTTTYYSATELMASIPVSYLTVNETAPVDVITSGIASNIMYFIVGTGGSTTALTINCSPGVGPATVGTVYTATCNASGGAGQYTWSTTGLPGYLTLSATSGTSVTLTGTPSQGIYNYTIKVADSSTPPNTGSQQFAGEANANSSGYSSTITSISPTSAPAGSSAVTLTINGSGFATGSIVSFNGYPLSPFTSTSGQLVVTIPAGYLAYAETASIVVTSSSGISNTMYFIIGNGGAGSQMSVNCIPGVGPAAVGSYYVTTCSVAGGTQPYNWSASSTLPAGLYLTPSGVTATIQGYPQVGAPYSYSIGVQDSSASPLTSSLLFAGNTSGGNPTSGSVTISALSPSSALVGSTIPVSMTVTGTGFTSASLVYFGSTLLSTQVNSSTQLTAQIPTSLLTVAGSLNVTVNTGGVSSNGLAFTVGSGTGTGGVSVSCTPDVGPTSSGTNYMSTCSVSGGKAPYYWTLSGTNVPSGMYLSSTTGTSTTAQGYLFMSSPYYYSYTIQMTDSSTPANVLTVPFSGVAGAYGGETITNISQSNAPLNSPSVTLTITGTGFNSLSTVAWAPPSFLISSNTPPYPIELTYNTTFLSSTQLMTTIPSSYLTSSGTGFLQVQTPTVGNSNIVSFAIANGSPVQITPSSLSFVYGIGGTLPSAQVLQVTGTGVTGFSISTTLASGTGWLAVSPTSGAIPGTVSVSVAPQALSPGTYTGSLQIAGFGIGSSTTIPITLVVEGAPTLTPTPSSLAFNGPAGGGALTQTVRVTSSDGNTILPYTATAISNNGGNWLSVTPSSGSTPGTFTVSANATNLSPSTYSGYITLNATGSVASTVYLEVSFAVTTPPTLNLSSSALTFSSQTGAANPAVQAFTVATSTGVATGFTVAATTQSGGSWLTATPASGTTPGTVSVAINNSGLAAGTYTGTITVTAPGTSNTPQRVAVTLTVTPPPALTISSQNLTFSGQVLGTTPAAQTISVGASTGNFSFTTSVATSTGGNWLSVTPGSGTTTSSITVSVNPAGLSAGSYSGTVTLTATGAANSPLAIPVTFTLAAASSLTLTPQTLAFSATVGGNSPPSQTFSTSASGSTAAGYTVASTTSTGGSWLSASPASGTTPGTVTVSVNPSGLTAGSYSGTVTVSSTAVGNSPQTVQVNLTVTTPSSLTIAPSALTFNVPSGSTTVAPQSVSIFDGSTTPAFTVAANTTAGGNWLTATGAASAPGSLLVSVNPASLTAGNTYNGTLTINSPNSSPASVTIPVTVNVSAVSGPKMQVAPANVLLSYTQGAATDAQRIGILNAGSGTINFSAQAQTASCGNWLTLLNTSGTSTPVAPGIIGFSVSSSGLSSQTCRATISVSDGLGNTTVVPVSMAVSRQSQAIELSQTVMTFQATANGPAPASQSFQVLNPGIGSMGWTLNSHVIGGSSWLSVSASSGSALAQGQPGSPVTVTANPQGLSSGTYYGTIQVLASGANNGPQTITVTLIVAASGTNAPPVALPSGVIIANSATPTVSISNPGSGTVGFSSSSISDDGGNWLTVNPASGTIAAGASASISLSANTSGLSSGLRHAALRFGFTDGSVQTVDVLLAISGSSSSTAAGVGNCGSTNLAVEFQNPSQNFLAPARLGVPLQVLVKDCSGNPVTNATAAVDVLASSGNDIRLLYSGNGVWSGTWTPASATAAMTLTAHVTAIANGGVATGTATATGSISAAPASAPPYISGVVNAASFQLPGLVAPLAMVSIFGSGLADSQQTVYATPFPTTLQGAQFTLGGQPLPLFYVSDGQVNAVVPSGLTPNERDQLIVVRDTTQSAPADLLVADSDPGIFAFNQQGSGQGAILNAGNSQLAGPVGVTSGSGPVTAGNYLEIFLSGLGAVSNTPSDGNPSSTSNPSLTKVNPAVTIGGAPAVVSYAGLAPGEVGVYQVNVVVPAGVQTGSAVPVVITLGNGVTNTVTVAIQ